MGDEISADERAEIGASLVLLAPPRQTNEVVKDVKVLAGQNSLIEGKILRSLLQYAMEQTIQVTLPGSSVNTLVTEHGHLGDGKFLCPRSHKSFRLDLFTHSVADVSSLRPDDRGGGSIKLEPWRAAIEDALTGYMRQNFPNGAVSVFAPADPKNSLIVIYVESSFHQNFRSGRWRSRWTLTIPDEIEGAVCQGSGEIRIQTHIFEEGNVQLLSSKSFKFEVVAKSPEILGREVCNKITECDSDYQQAIGSNLTEMSSKCPRLTGTKLPPIRWAMNWRIPPPSSHPLLPLEVLLVTFVAPSPSRTSFLLFSCTHSSRST
ncbi:capping protein actin filament muscle Z line [Echinococcus multilocularis]|uniref:F-actin-capping protein subunit alpha n=1 Tax=Echinococcus multilocularis TaxID=6211 RepID=A0A068YFS1_ECHMU|nr:capping protein actin filament muscle Z line [Echinococcus multilocularis]